MRKRRRGAVVVPEGEFLLRKLAQRVEQSPLPEEELEQLLDQWEAELEELEKKFG